MSHDHESLAREEYRLDTFERYDFAADKKKLAQAGFYYTKKGDEVKCFDCKWEVDAKTISPADDIARLHKEKRPDCHFAQGLRTVPKPSRSKTFISYDSLRFEKERLETFIDWPIQWLDPSELASDGLYYLRTSDHCACVFCRGIIGAWEVGDTPRGEHQRHFSHCPFIRGQPVGNVPIHHSDILARLPYQNSTPQTNTSTKRHGIDECGTSRHMAGSYPECRGPPNKPDVSWEEIGLPQYSGPKRKDFLTAESRLASFVRWPERVTQKPCDLAEAGFFYCGLSDHVRCFHCGNGLRNWEKDDVPWNEHARWYPECSYVLLKKGQEFIDKVRREKPPYIRKAPAVKPSSSTAPTTSSANASSGSRTVSDKDLDPLMDLDIIRGVLGMGFPPHIVRAALKDHVQKTGMPYFSMEPCIEAVLQKMEEETRRTLQSDDTIESEATESQVAKIQSINSRNDTVPSSEVAGSSSPSTSGAPASPPSEPSTSSVNEDITETLPTLPTPSMSVASAEHLPTLPNSPRSMDTTSPAPRQQESTQETSATPQTTSSASPQSSQGDDNAMEVDERGADVHQVPADRIHPMERVIMQADEVMSMAEEALKPPSSGPPSLNQSDLKVVGEGEGAGLLEQASTSGLKTHSGAVSSPQSTKELADELERIRDIRMCKVCMDAEMDVVFLPCAHMVTCASCAVALTQCPICRKDIKYTIKPIVS
ncbi:death-associated inhibitor of apoptosis 2-like [Penaeus japonicus]|uniref:death-associated inhibitor of apoptosis 2-like n=1 Tax=Penaeus japonicus TaxID=27405 RepID=UPI001C70BF9B|nr:death-associated inhibitor of apoptosis 2-like [Penaeus japonicus]